VSKYIRDISVNGVLLNNISSDTQPDQEGFHVTGATMSVSVRADDFGGGTVSLECSADGGIKWAILLKPDGNPAAFTVDSDVLVDRLSPGQMIRATLAGSTAPSNVKVQAFE
jgi:hypothetical protein